MKSFLLKSLFIVGIVGVIVMLTTCKKDTECHAVIIVKFYHDTTQVVSDAEVVIQKGVKYVEGTTDASGRFKHTFQHEKIMEVIAVKDTSDGTINPPPPPLQGEAVIRLQPGKTVERTVFIQ